MLPCTGRTWTCPSRGLCSPMFFSADTAEREAGTFNVPALADPSSVDRYSGYIVFTPPLVCGPPRLRYPSFRCVVVIFSVLPTHSPVEKPVQLWGAHAGGWGRPSMK